MQKLRELKWFDESWAPGMLPMSDSAGIVVRMAAGFLVLIYLSRLVYWWQLLRLRNRGRSAASLVLAVVSSIQVLDLLEASRDSDDSTESEEQKES